MKLSKEEKKLVQDIVDQEVKGIQEDIKLLKDDIDKLSSEIAKFIQIFPKAKGPNGL